MSDDWSVEYKAKVREFIAKKGAKIEVDNRYSFGDDDDVSTYGWHDYAAGQHCFPESWREKYPERFPDPPCHWIVPEGAKLYERSYSMFTDTFHSNQDEIGVNVKGCRCACGKYEDVILRWTGTLAEMLHDILGMPNLRAEVEL